MIQYFPLYRASDAIYGENGSVQLPFALVRKVKETQKARLLRHKDTKQEAWFPESIFSYHWHVLNAAEMHIFVTLPDVWVKKKAEFFGGIHGNITRTST